MTTQDGINRVRESAENKIKFQMSLGLTYQEAKAIVKSQTVAGPALWSEIDAKYQSAT